MTDSNGTRQSAGMKDSLQAAQADLWRLRFPPDMEREFRANYDRQSVVVIRKILPWITALYLVIAGVMMLALHGDAVETWRDNAVYPVGGALVFLWIAFASRRLDRHVAAVVMCALVVATASALRGLFLVEGSEVSRYGSYTLFYLVLLTYSLSRLRLRQALATTVLVLGIVLADIGFENLRPDWLAFSQYFVIVSGFCAVLGYVLEHRERADWLKSKQLAHDKEEIQRMRAAAEADSRRQRLTGQYLELVAGNLTAVEIANRSLKFLIEHAGAQIGAVYAFDGERLRRTASWALGGELASPDQLGRGETLVGQVARDARRLRLEHLPADYHRIRSGAGDVSPRELLLEPARYQGNVLAVIELGALAAFDETALDLVDHVARAMAATLVAANARDALARAGMDEFAI